MNGELKIEETVWEEKVVHDGDQSSYVKKMDDNGQTKVEYERNKQKEAFPNSDSGTSTEPKTH